MASILKVDQIQLPDGSAPTASDLGVIPSADEVVQVVTSHSNTRYAVAAGTTWQQFADLNISITPKYATSKLFIIAHTYAIGGSAYNGLSLALLEGTTEVGTRVQVAQTTDLTALHAATTTVPAITPAISTNTRTFHLGYIDTVSANTGSVRINNYDPATATTSYTYLVAYEIAQ